MELGCSEALVAKVVSVWEVMEASRGLALVGPTMGGKTAVWRLLAAIMKRTKVRMEERVRA